MKQGSGRSTNSGGKVEPRSHSVSLDKVSGIGIQRIRTHPESKALYNGRGIEAPKATSSIHRSGSQGKR